MRRIFYCCCAWCSFPSSWYPAACYMNPVPLFSYVAITLLILFLKILLCNVAGFELCQTNIRSGKAETIRAVAFVPCCRICSLLSHLYISRRFLSRFSLCFVRVLFGICSCFKLNLATRVEQESNKTTPKPLPVRLLACFLSPERPLCTKATVKLDGHIAAIILPKN